MLLIQNTLIKQILDYNHISDLHSLAGATLLE